MGDLNNLKIVKSVHNGGARSMGWETFPYTELTHWQTGRLAKSVCLPASQASAKRWLKDKHRIGVDDLDNRLGTDRFQAQ